MSDLLLEICGGPAGFKEPKPTFQWSLCQVTPARFYHLFVSLILMLTNEGGKWLQALHSCFQGAPLTQRALRHMRVLWVVNYLCQVHRFKTVGQLLNCP